MKIICPSLSPPAVPPAYPVACRDPHSFAASFRMAISDHTKAPARADTRHKAGSIFLLHSELGSHVGRSGCWLHVSAAGGLFWRTDLPYPEPWCGVFPSLSPIPVSPCPLQVPSGTQTPTEPSSWWTSCGSTRPSTAASSHPASCCWTTPTARARNSTSEHGPGRTDSLSRGQRRSSNTPFSIG